MTLFLLALTSGDIALLVLLSYAIHMILSWVLNFIKKLYVKILEDFYRPIDELNSKIENLTCTISRTGNNVTDSMNNSTYRIVRKVDDIRTDICMFQLVECIKTLLNEIKDPNFKHSVKAVCEFVQGIFYPKTQQNTKNIIETLTANDKPNLNNGFVNITKSDKSAINNEIYKSFLKAITEENKNCNNDSSNNITTKELINESEEMMRDVSDLQNKVNTVISESESESESVVENSYLE